MGDDRGSATMWPFRRRRHSDGSIDLDDLLQFAETNPVKIYVNLLLLDMAFHAGEDADNTSSLLSLTS